MNDKKVEKVNPMSYSEILATSGSLPLPATVGKIVIEKSEMTVKEYLSVMDKRGAVPVWQRSNDLWPKAARQYLLHSLLFALPVPPIILVERENKLFCDDGGQRTYSIRAEKAEIETAITANKAIIDDDKASDDAKANAKAELDKLNDLLGRLNTATISVWVVKGATEEVERYIYAALNNGKAHNGGDKGASFVPSTASEFLAETVKICTPITDSRGARILALYFWAAENIEVGKCPAGGKAFPLSRNITSAEGYIAPTKAPYWLKSFANAAAGRAKGKDAMYSPAFWSKAAAAVMVSHGVKCYTDLLNDKIRIAKKAIGDYEQAKKEGKKGKDFERKADKAAKAVEMLPTLQDALSTDSIAAAVGELVGHFEKYDTTPYTIIVGKGTAKNGPVTSKVRACDYIAKSGSGESLSYAKAQLFGNMLFDAHNANLQKPKDDDNDPLLSELEDIARGEGAIDE